MLFLTPLFLQIKICTRFCYTWELSHSKGLLKQKHYPQRTYLRLTFDYWLQCTGDLDKRWHIASRTIHSIHLYGFTYYIPTEQFIYIYPCLVHPSPTPTIPTTFIRSLVSFTWCRPDACFLEKKYKTQNNIPMFKKEFVTTYLNIWSNVPSMFGFRP